MTNGAPTEQLPSFIDDIAQRFLSRQTNQFLLAGNVVDELDGLGITCPPSSPQDPARFAPVENVLIKRLDSRGRLVVLYDLAGGIRFTTPEKQAAVGDWYAGLGTEPSEVENRRRFFDRVITESQTYSLLALRFLNELCDRARSQRSGPVSAGLSIVVKHVETLLPEAPLGQMSDVDRQKLTLLVEWLSAPEFCESIDQIILISSTFSGVHSHLRRLPQLCPIEVPRPTAQERLAYLQWRSALLNLSPDRLPAQLDQMTAGMTLSTLRGLLQQALHAKDPLGPGAVLSALNKLLVSELGDKVEIVKPPHSMADVVGATALKAELERTRRLLESRDPGLSPPGILVAGPNGVGKTFIIEAWANSCDRLVIVLKNLRGMYFGETDQIFEKLRSVLEALGNVIILVDEADTVFSKPGRDTHETEARLFGNVIRMMSEPRNRGRIVWVLMTARPERLAPDLKRSGRAGLHLPVFDPEGDDRRAYVDSVLKRAGFDVKSLLPEERAAIDEATRNLSPADFNELLSELKAEKYLQNRALVAADVSRVVGSIMTGQIARQRRFQTLQALRECSRKALVPPSLAAMTPEQVEAEATELEAQLNG